MLFFYSLVFIISTIVLIRSGSLLIRSLVNISKFMEFSEFVVAFILVGIGTSLPELFVGISSGLKKMPSLSLGNALGSNVLNLTFISGFVILLARGVEIRNRLKTKDVWIIFLLSVLPLLFLLNKVISRLEGAFLVLAFVIFIIYLAKSQKSLVSNAKIEKFPKLKSLFSSVIYFIIALVLLLISSWLVIFSIGKLAAGFGFSMILAGMFLVAIGTSLPELIFGVRAVLSNHEEMNIGNILGSCVANSCLVLGVTALFSPIAITYSAAFISAGVFMVISLVVFNLFLRSQSYLAWWEGILLILLYLGFVIAQSIL